MAVDFRMPDVGEGITEGEIVQWLIAEGAEVKEDDALVEVQTDKAIVQIPSPASGVLLRQGAAEGEVIAVGSTLALIGDAGERGAAAAGQEASKQSAPAAARPAEKAPEARPAPPAPVEARQAAPALGEERAAGEVKATPAVRHMARQLGVDLATVPATGPNGRVTREDVEAAASGKTAGAGTPAPALPARAAEADEPAMPARPTPAPVAIPETHGDQRLPLRGLRRTIARRMVQSAYTAPHVTTLDEAEVSALVAMRERLKPLAEARGVRLTYLPFVIKAVAAVLREFPMLNASLDDEKQEIVLHGDIHIGIATATEDGLMVPVVRSVDQKSILQLAAQVRERSERARGRTSELDELRGSTFTITNIGSVGGLAATPIINYPEVAILGVYRISDRPVVRQGAVVAGKVMGLSLTFDHRVIDGEMGARALRRIADLLENPDHLVLEMA
jgi:pyruvate dehydrogenase E2 component (dihydrolipoamide acetyltransferase)